MSYQHTADGIPVSIIGGYLGSGKTTLVNHLLKHRDSTRIAVLVNDFGTLAIDAELIEANDENIISLSGGCVCCSYGNDLSTALMQVMALQPQPDHIVIESSGVALPGAIASSLSLLQGLRLFGIVVLVDAETIRNLADDRYVGDTIERQLSCADLLVLNKTDLLNQSTRQETQSWLKQRWPNSRVICVSHAKVPIDILLDNVPSATTTNPASDENVPEFHSAIFDTFTISPPAGMNAHVLAAALAGDELSLSRAKGIVQSSDGSWQLIQIVGRRWSVQSLGTGTDLPEVIVCIGPVALVDKAAVNSYIRKVSGNQTTHDH